MAPTHSFPTGINARGGAQPTVPAAGLAEYVGRPHAVVVAADLTVLATLLETEGYTVTAVGSVFGTHELIRRLAPAVVVLDAELPYRSGLALLVALRADPATAGVPVVLLSALADAIPNHRRALASGIVAKPWTPAAVRAALQTATSLDPSAAGSAPPADGRKTSLRRLPGRMSAMPPSTRSTTGHAIRQGIPWR
jgi:CheY-like chemotaxis protein